MDEKPCKHRIVSFLSTGLCTTNFRLTVNCCSLLLLVCNKILNSSTLINYNFTRHALRVSLLQTKQTDFFMLRPCALQKGDGKTLSPFISTTSRFLRLCKNLLHHKAKNLFGFLLIFKILP